MKRFLPLILFLIPHLSRAQGIVVNASSFPVDPSGATDSYIGLQAAVNQAIAANAELYLPKGTYKTSATIVAPSNTFKMRCAGAVITTISASAGGYDTFVVGPSSFNASPNGYIQDCTFSGLTRAAASSGNTALKIKSMIQMQLIDVALDNDDICLDYIGNSFGTQINNLRAGINGNCNVGINLRNGGQSGSDLTFINPWVMGNVAAVHIAGSGGGYHFWGGQLGGGVNNGGDNDNNGTIIMGKDYLTGSTSGESSIDIVGTSFEPTNNVWAFRTYNQVKISIYGAYFNPASTTHKAIGFYKGTGMAKSRIFLSNSTISGNWSGANLLSFAGATIPVVWWEEFTYTASANPSINGSNVFVNSMAEQSGLLANAVVFDGVGAGLKSPGHSTGAGAPSAGACTTSTGGFLYTRTDGTTTTSLYVCDGATGTWTAK